MRPIQQARPLASPPRSPARRRLGRAQGVDPRGHLQTPSASSDSRQLCHRLPLVAGHGHAAPPGIASWAAASRHTVSGHRAALLPRQNRVLPPGPLNAGGKTYLSAFLLSLNLLAFLFHTVLEWSDAKYTLLRQALSRRQTFFQDTKNLMYYLVFDHWDHLMEFMIRGLELESPYNTS